LGVGFALVTANKGSKKARLKENILVSFEVLFKDEKEDMGKSG
jgi:hypothetical protein